MTSSGVLGDFFAEFLINLYDTILPAPQRSRLRGQGDLLRTNNLLLYIHVPRIGLPSCCKMSNFIKTGILSKDIQRE